MTSKLEILSLFGFTRDPFFGHDVETADAARVRSLLSMAVSARSQVAIIGDRGIGKTRAVNAALRDLKIEPTRVLGPDKARVTAGDIQEALLIELAGTEKIRQDKEIRIRALRRVLGAASKKGPVVVVIEEAHRLHGQTLRSVKNLRELDWMGETHLFAVILIGQSDPSQRPGMSEVRLRTETVHMHGLTRAEVVDYARATVGAVFDPAAIQAVADLPEAKNYLDLQELLVAGMSNAFAAGREQVTAEDLADTARPSPRSEIRQKPKTGNSGAVQSVLGRKQAKTGLRAVEERPA